MTPNLLKHSSRFFSNKNAFFPILTQVVSAKCVKDKTFCEEQYHDPITKCHLRDYIISTNIGLFFLGISCQRKPASSIFFIKNFVSSYKNLIHYRWHTLVLSNFCHLSPTHLLFNCLGYHTLLSNTNVNKILQPQDIIQCLILCGVGSTLGHVVVSKNPVLGASGCLIGLMTFQTFLFPSQKYTLLFPLYGCILSSFEILVILFSTNLFGSIFLSKRLRIAWIGHLVAHCLGGAYAMFYIREKDPFFYSRIKNMVYQFAYPLKSKITTDSYYFIMLKWLELKLKYHVQDPVLWAKTHEQIDILKASHKKNKAS